MARRFEGMRFALGATMAVRRSTLAAIGGFEALVDYCADDYELGRRVAATRPSGRVERLYCLDRMCGEDYECVSEPSAAMGRDHPPRATVGLSGATPHDPGPAGITSGRNHRSIYPVAVAYLSAYVVLRLALSWTSAKRLNDEVARRRWWLVPVWDAVAFGVGLAALVTNRIDWRGRFYMLQRGEACRPPPLSPHHGLVSDRS